MAITAKGLQKLGFLPHEDFVLQTNGNAVEIRDWLSSEPIPSEADIETAYAAWENDYARNRKEEYPSIHDFMEAYTEKEIGTDSTKWDAYVIAYNKVRTDNPKS